MCYTLIHRPWGWALAHSSTPRAWNCWSDFRLLSTLLSNDPKNISWHLFFFFLLIQVDNGGSVKPLPEVETPLGKQAGPRLEGLQSPSLSLHVWS